MREKRPSGLLVPDKGQREEESKGELVREP